MIVHEGVAYAAAGHHIINGVYVYALDAASGRELWAFPAGAAIDSSPAIANGVIYFTGVVDNSGSGGCGRLFALK